MPAVSSNLYIEINHLRHMSKMQTREGMYRSKRVSSFVCNAYIHNNPSHTPSCLLSVGVHTIDDSSVFTNTVILCSFTNVNCSCVTQSNLLVWCIYETSIDRRCRAFAVVCVFRIENDIQNVIAPSVLAYNAHLTGAINEGPSKRQV